MPNGYFNPQLSFSDSHTTHPEALYLFSCFCHVIVFCFPSSNIMSVSLTSSSFMLLYVLFHKSFICILPSFLFTFPLKYSHKSRYRLGQRQMHPHHLSVPHFIVPFILVFCVHTQRVYTHIHSSFPPSVQSESVSSGLTCPLQPRSTW